MEFNEQLEMLKGDQMSLRALMEGYSGMRTVRSLMETQTTSDFPLLFADAIDRQVLLGYQEAPATFRDYVRTSTVPDFRQVSRYQMTGLEGTLPQVAEKANYGTRSMDEARYQYAVAKYGAQFDLSWETIRNDDLGALQDAPQRLGRAARRTEYSVATQQFADDALRGPGEFFQNGRNAIIAGGADLDPANLATLYNMMIAVTDADGEPIFNEPKYLVVPPALKLTGMNILNSTIIRELLDAAATIEGERVNYWGQMLELRVNHYAPFVDGATPNTAWYLFADPANVSAVEVGWLRGHEQPQTFIKAADAIPIGGGAADPFAGDFDSDNVLYKVRHVVGGTRLDWRGCFMSDGV